MQTLLATTVFTLLAIVGCSTVLIISRRRYRGGCHELSGICHKQPRPACETDHLRQSTKLG